MSGPMVYAVMTGAFALGCFIFLMLVIAVSFPPDDSDRKRGGGMIE